MGPPAAAKIPSKLLVAGGVTRTGTSVKDGDGTGCGACKGVELGSAVGSILGGAVYAVSINEVAVMYVDGLVKGVDPAEPVGSMPTKICLSRSEPQPCANCSTQGVGATLP